MHKLFFNHSVATIIAAAALTVSIQAEAATVFPPAHLSELSQFAAPASEAAATPIVPWYFAAQSAPRESISEAVGNAPEVVTTAVASPWYRSAN